LTGGQNNSRHVLIAGGVSPFKAFGQNLELSLRLPYGRVCPETPDHQQKAGGSRLEYLVFPQTRENHLCDAERDPELGWFRPAEVDASIAFRRNAYHREPLAVDSDRLTEDRRTSVEVRRPQLVAQDHARPIVVAARLEVPADC